MSMLLFMPWCPIDKSYQAGEITILPSGMDGLDQTTQCRVSAILSTYKDIEGNPMRNIAIVRYGKKSPIEDLRDEEVEVAQDLAVLACFSGLAKCDYLNSGGCYCNSDCFSLYVQKFEKADFTAITTRRRDGRTMSAWPIERISITIPVHCNVIREVSLDEALLGALIAYREHENGGWGRWQNAMTCFNQANTDSDNIRYQMEWVLLCSAFEHLLDADSNAKNVASKFTNVLAPSKDLSTKDSKRPAEQLKKDGKPLRYEWMREFYRIRGDFAHGRLDTQQPSVWDPLEHLVLATIAFPLVVKCLLSKGCKYSLTDKDKAQIESFERFADTVGFLKPPPNQRGTSDSHWKRLVDGCKTNISMDRVFNSVWSGLTPEQKKCLESSDSEEHR